jgi:hypothetical protein
MLFEKEILKIPMSDNTLNRRIQDMSQDTGSLVTTNIKEGDFLFTIRLDQSINITEKAQLLAFSRVFGMDISLNNFRFAKHSQKQQMPKKIFMSTVISVLAICLGNHASASARTVPLCI